MAVSDQKEWGGGRKTEYAVSLADPEDCSVLLYQFSGPFLPVGGIGKPAEGDEHSTRLCN